MKPQWQKLASLAQEICTLWFQFFSAVFASKGYPFKNILEERDVHLSIVTTGKHVLEAFTQRQCLNGISSFFHNLRHVRGIIKLFILPITIFIEEGRKNL